MFQARSQKTCTESDGHAMNHGIDKKDTLPGDSPDSHSVMKSKGSFSFGTWKNQCPMIQHFCMT